MNRNVTLLSRRLYSPSLKDVAWLERAQLNFLISHTFVRKFGGVDGAARENYSLICLPVKMASKAVIRPI